MASLQEYKLFDTQTANGNSTSIKHFGDSFTVFAAGTWDGATVKIQVSPDNTTFIDVTGGTFTADGVYAVVVAPGTYVRLNIAGVGASTDVDAWYKGAK